jgi:hypothetical protein
MKFVKLYKLLKNLYSIQDQFDDIKIMQGNILNELMKVKKSTLINDYEFKVFSQWGEDGIIQKLINSVDLPNKNFVEFGVQDFKESNCRFLLKSGNWRGLVIDANQNEIDDIKSSGDYWKFGLTAVCEFINRDNINNILKSGGMSGDIGLLSIDIDGVDWWILKAIDSVNPRILIVEYNSIFGPERKITVPYDPAFNRLTKHHSGIYYGASLAAFDYLVSKRGYKLVGANLNGSNAFFVREDVIQSSGIHAKTVEDVFIESKVRESRGGDGQLTFVDGAQRAQLLKGLPVFNVETERLEFL